MGVFAPWILSLAIAHKLKERVENFVFVSIAIISAVIYIFGLCKMLEPGVYVACALVIVSIVYCIYAFISDRAEFMHLLFSPASIFVVFIILFFGAMSMGRAFFHNDDLHQYGLGIKFLYYYKDVYVRGRQYHHVHPIGTMLWDYFCTRTYTRFSESIMMCGQNVLLVSVMMPLFSFASGRHRAIKAICVGIVLILLPIAVIEYVYASLLTDVLMSLMFGYLLVAVIQFYSEHDYVFIWHILAGLYILVQTKRFSIIPAAIILLIITFFFFQNRDSMGNPARRWGLFIGSFVCVIIPYFSWSFLIEHQWGVSIVFPVVALVGGAIMSFFYDNRALIREHEDMFVMLCFIAMVGLMVIFAKLIVLKSAYSLNVTRLFWEYLITVDERGSGEESYIGNIIRLPWLYFVLSVLIVSLILAFLMYRGDMTSLKEKLSSMPVFFQTLALTAMGIAGYILVLLVTYIYQIPNWGEGDYVDHLPSFFRYMLPCYYCIVVVGLYYIIKSSQQKGLWSILIGLCLVLSISNAGDLIRYITEKHQEIKFYGFENAGIELTPDDCINYIDQKPVSNEYTEYFKYSAFPATAFEFDYLYENPSFADMDYMDKDRFEWWLNEDDFTYVYIQTIDDKFIDRYGELFEDTSHIGNVYSVEHDENGKLYLHCCDPK